MAHLFNGTTSKLLLSSALITATPLTFACFFKHTAVGGSTQTLMAADDGVAVTNAFTLSTGSTDTVTLATIATSSSSSVTTEVGILNNWNTAVGITQSSISRYGAVNSRLATQSTTSRVPSGINEFIIGGRGSGLLSWNGLLAEVAVWQAALTPRELQSYSEGKSPRTIRPENLLLYMPLTIQVGSADLGPQSLVLANTACVPVADHPLMLQSTKRLLRTPRFLLK